MNKRKYSKLLNQLIPKSLWRFCKINGVNTPMLSLKFIRPGLVPVDVIKKFKTLTL